jgi:hypothetical protein
MNIMIPFMRLICISAWQLLQMNALQSHPRITTTVQEI